jgi:uncharacterized protein
MLHGRTSVVIPFALAILAFAPGHSQNLPRFTPMSITMRDGKSLSADLYSMDTTVARPLVVIQTPYNTFLMRYTLSNPPGGGTVLPFDSVHYNYLTVDWRGFYGSLLAASPGYDRGKDGYDIIEWAATQRWCNGKIGTWGVSALGYIQFETMKHHPPHHVCAMPMMKDYKTKYSDYFPGGVYRKEFTASLQRLGFLDTTTILAHPTKDWYWNLAESATDYPESIAVPVLIVGGWFDHFPDDVIRAFEDLQSRSSSAVQNQHKLIVGPWLHADMEDTLQGQLSYPAAVGIASSAAQEFFDYYLCGMANGYSSHAAVRYYQMGEEMWKESSTWSGIARSNNMLYFGNGTLMSTPIESTDVIGQAFSFDPRSPSPAIGGPRFNPFTPGIPVGPQDQRALVESRKDVLTYTTAPLTEPMEIVGAVKVVLAAISNRTDTDFTVRLCDVYPDGRSMLMSQGTRRLRFRDSYSSPQIGVIANEYQVIVDMTNLALTLLPGHALRLDVSSSIYPQYDLNLNNGGAMYTAGDTLVALNTVSIRSYAVVPTRSTVSVNSPALDVPVVCVLKQNYPNPFNPMTVLSCQVSVAGRIRLAVYDVLGREVATLIDGQKEPGKYEVTFDGKGLASGVYVYQLTVRDYVESKKMLFLR